jgi:hypothetical protein
MEYLNPRMVQTYGNLNKPNYKDISCYDGIIYKVCPNPDKDEICKTIESRYKNGLYIDKKIFSLTKEQFENPKFWNSEV